jgi:photosystem II stability/assembly factor-like uncharacterized protein
MSNVTRGAAVLLVLAGVLPGAAGRVLHAQTSAALPDGLLHSWSWRSVGPDAETFASIVTDTGFPYRICGTTRTGRSACAPSRSDAREKSAVEWIDFRRATPVAIDPADPDVIYGGAVERFDRRTAQFQDVSPVWNDTEAAPAKGVLLFAPADPRTLYFGGSVLRKTSNGGINWTVAGPASGPANIAAMAISSVDPRVMWVEGAGVLQVTRDAGVSWIRSEVPVDWMSLRIEASRFDPSTAYLAATAADDPARTHLLRTRDGGRTWQLLDRGLPASVRVNAVREDSIRRGLLFAATSHGVLISIDDGDSWQSMTLNLPAGAAAEITIHDADVIAAIEGHGAWVLDDMSPLREMTPDLGRADAFLFRPAVAWRLRTRDFTTGATFYYLVGSDAASPFTIEVLETASGEIIRRFSTEDGSLSRSPGLHRLNWDLRSLPIRDRGVLVSPGTYQVRMAYQGRVFRQALVVRIDPRIRTSASDLDAQSALSRRVYAKLRETEQARARNGNQDADRAALDAAAAALADVLGALQQSDTRPTPALAALAATAVDRASALLGAATR